MEKHTKDPAAVELGRRGGLRAAQRMTAKERIDRAKKANAGRWAKHRGEKGVLSGVPGATPSPKRQKRSSKTLLPA